MDTNYTPETKQKIMSMKDVISLKEFYWESEKEFEKTRDRVYLLTQGWLDLTKGLGKMTLLASNDNTSYQDEYIFSIDYKHEFGRVDFHGWSITNAPIELVSYKRITA